MPVFLLLKRLVVRQFSQLNGLNLCVASLTYAIISWALLLWARESALTQSLTDFLYYLVVTGSTVGYGDMSPTTEQGKWVAALFIIPCGIGLFALVVGQMARMMVLFWKRGLLGKRRTTMTDHIIILGWNGQKTERLIKLLREGEKGKSNIVLCARDDMENPLPGEIDFVRVNNYTDTQTMSRAAVTEAEAIIIDIPEDDFTLAAALFCSSVNKTAHILAYFQDEDIGDLLRLHCPNVDCVPSVSTEMLAKATIDPGSSQLHHQLLDANNGMTQYSIKYDAPDSTPIQQLFVFLKLRYHATLIAIDKGQGEGLVINPDISVPVDQGDTLFYIAEHRIKYIQWSEASAV